MNSYDEYTFSCPYCGSENSFLPDGASGSQQMVVDCETCCKPILLRLRFQGGRPISVDARRENE